MNAAPRLPANWRAMLREARARGIPNTRKHQFAFRISSTRSFRQLSGRQTWHFEQVDAWWVLMMLPHDGRWQHFLTADDTRGAA